MTENQLPQAKADRKIITPVSELRKLKDLLGPLQVETIETGSLSEAHYKLGENNSRAINSLLENKISGFGPEKTGELLDQSRKIYQHMLDRSRELQSTDPEISSAISDYLQCLQSWSQGAKLDQSPASRQFTATGLELALMLQNDAVGCQTIMIRGKNGELLFGHSEEDDTPDRARHNTWTEFVIKGRDTISAYTSYSDLLPGPAFCKTPHGIMASDIIFVKPVDQIGFLANSVSWIIWKMGSETESHTVVQKLLPACDGLAINQAYVDPNGKVIGKVIEFGQGKMSHRFVGENPGDHSYHTNAIDETSSVKQLEDLEPSDINLFNRRNNTLKTILNAIKNRPDHSFPDPLKSLKKIFAFRGSKSKQWGYHDAQGYHLFDKIKKYQGVASDWSRAVFLSTVHPDGQINYDIESGPVIR